MFFYIVYYRIFTIYFFLLGEERIYLSLDSIDLVDLKFKDDFVFFLEFLNSIKILGLFNYVLRFRIGILVMLIRNLDFIEG